MFVFSLQSVLDYRNNIEEKIHGEFSEKKRELEIEELKLINLINEVANLIDELRKMQNKPLPVDDIARCVVYVEQVRENEKKQRITIAQVAEQLAAKRNELLEAVKKRKIMEKLKERHTEECIIAARALEQKNSDEMAVLKFGRREK
ncbi:MAG: flagellar export protein FliJ [Deltaproteobacteria bacterium HGW-Deltaproteobacteria-10]|nr:MAG: flagellar export protein FliJ [Deltaproteobacteria bacterium HGW-Deltaproteobacteria-10]